MASPGHLNSNHLLGMDGYDHAYRQRVASHYQASVLNKSRLKYCVFFHYSLFFVMLAKLTPCVLDWFNIFILDIEELEIPEPYLWEWIWLSSLLVSFFCLDAIKKNKISSLKYYMIGIVLLGYLPILCAIISWFPDVYLTLFSNDDIDKTSIIYWNEYPCGLLWYGFILVCLQVHSFSMYFSYNLLSVWKSRLAARKME